VKKVVGFVVVLVVLVGIKFFTRSGDKEEILADMKKLVVRIEGYDQHAEYLDKLLEREHNRVFDKAYDMGGRRRGASFDETKYLGEVLTGMAADCERTKRTDLANSLRQYRDTLLAEPDADS